MTGSSTHSYDFKIRGKNILIEVDGDYWHGGPGCLKHHKDVKETKKNDLIKTGFAEEMGFRLLRYWESDINNNWEVIKTEILEIVE